MIRWSSSAEIGAFRQRGRGFRGHIVIDRGKLQLSLRAHGLVGVAHRRGEGEKCAFVTALHFLDARLEFALQQLRAHDRGAVRLPGPIAVRLRRDVLGETLALRFAESAERFVVERRVKRDPGRVQLLDDRHVQALFRDQHFNVSATQ